MQGSIKRRIRLQAGQGKKQDPTSKITNVKSAGGLALSQVVECLPSKREALTSTPSTAKKKKQNKTNKQPPPPPPSLLS
jgi:hypothetical protein